jgi:hypothetical protein
VLHGSAWLVVAGSGRAGLGRARQGEDVFTFRKSLKNGFEAIRDFDSWCESVIDA